jgi:hypothetical protein
MTMATMGRLIKNFDMAGYLFFGFSGASCFGSGFEAASGFAGA